MRLSPDGKELYVANVQDGSVSVLDVSTRQEVTRIAVGKAPVQVGFTPMASAYSYRYATRTVSR